MTKKRLDKQFIPPVGGYKREKIEQEIDNLPDSPFDDSAETPLPPEETNPIAAVDLFRYIPPNSNLTEVELAKAVLIVTRMTGGMKKYEAANSVGITDRTTETTRWKELLAIATRIFVDHLSEVMQATNRRIALKREEIVTHIVELALTENDLTKVIQAARYLDDSIIGDLMAQVADQGYQEINAAKSATRRNFSPIAILKEDDPEITYIEGEIVGESGPKQLSEGSTEALPVSRVFTPQEFEES